MFWSCSKRSFKSPVRTWLYRRTCSCSVIKIISDCPKKRNALRWLKDRKMLWLIKGRWRSHFVWVQTTSFLWNCVAKFCFHCTSRAFSSVISHREEKAGWWVEEPVGRAWWNYTYPRSLYRESRRSVLFWNPSTHQWHDQVKKRGN